MNHPSECGQLMVFAPAQIKLQKDSCWHPQDECFMSSTLGWMGRKKDCIACIRHYAWYHIYIYMYVYICLKDKKSAPLNHQSSKYHTYTANIFIQSAVEVQLNDCKLCLYCICGIHWMQCRHYRFLAGKDAIVAATSSARYHCHHRFLIIKIQLKSIVVFLFWLTNWSIEHVFKFGPSLLKF